MTNQKGQGGGRQKTHTGPQAGEWERTEAGGKKNQEKSVKKTNELEFRRYHKLLSGKAEDKS